MLPWLLLGPLLADVSAAHREDDAAIYRLALAGRGSYVIAESSAADRCGKVQGIDDTAASFNERNREHPPIRQLLPVPPPARIVSDAEIDSTFDPPLWRRALVSVRHRHLWSWRDKWPYFHERFGAESLVSLSAIGWSRQGNQALLYVASSSDGLAGSGECFLYERIPTGGFRLSSQWRLWIS